jgi:hypothetical protein
MLLKANDLTAEKFISIFRLLDISQAGKVVRSYA